MKEAPWAKAAFRDARDHRGQQYHRALRGLAARWMRVLWTCWSTCTPYDPTRHTTAIAAPDDGLTSTTDKPPATLAARLTPLPPRPRSTTAGS